MELLEREPLLAELEAVLAEASAISGRVALVSGEAGIGKTSLVEAFVRRKRDTVRVLWGASDSLSTPRPLGPLHDMALQLQEKLPASAPGSLPALLQSGAGPAAIFSHVLVELQRRTTIAVFEDVHWADEATLDLLRYLGRRITRTSALLILTYRDDELGLQHPLRGLLGDLASSGTARRLVLPALSESAVRAMVGRRGMDAGDLHRRTGGNPFFVTEVLASAGDGIPATVRDAVLARAAALSPPARGVLEASSVIGARIEPWLLSDLSGLAAGALDEIVGSGMLVYQGDVLSFRHELARQTILAEVSPLRRRELHRAVLRLLQFSPAARTDLARLAHHASAAGDGPAVLAYAPAAARQASAASAHRESAKLYVLALKYAGELPPREMAGLLVAYAEECNSVDDRAGGVAALRRALEIFRSGGDVLGQGLTLAQMANLLVGVGGDVEAEECCQEAIHLLENCQPGRELAHAYRVRASLDLIEHKYAEAVAWAEKSIALAERNGDTAELYSARSILGSSWMGQDYEYGCRLLEASREAADAAGRKATAALAYANMGSISAELYRLQRAAEYLEAGLVYTGQHDLDRLRYYMLAWKSYTDVHLGRWEAAETAAGEVLRLALRSSTSRLMALVSLGLLRTRQGNPEGQALLDAALEHTGNMTSIDRLGPVRTARAEAAWLAGDRDRTVEEARSVYDLAVSRGQAWYAGELAFWRWRAGDNPPLPDGGSTAAIARPFALQMAGDWRTAAEEWERLGCPYEQARALADGDPAAQITALALFERLGAIPAANALRQALRSSGASRLPHKPRAATRSNPFQLTARQVEILALLVEGCSNAEIAARLHITGKTADHHVSAVLDKLGVHSRKAAADLARQNPHFFKK